MVLLPIVLSALDSQDRCMVLCCSISIGTCCVLRFCGTISARGHNAQPSPNKLVCRNCSHGLRIPSCRVSPHRKSCGCVNMNLLCMHALPISFCQKTMC